MPPIFYVGHYVGKPVRRQRPPKPTPPSGLSQEVLNDITSGIQYEALGTYFVNKTAALYKDDFLNMFKLKFTAGEETTKMSHSGHLEIIKDQVGAPDIDLSLIDRRELEEYPLLYGGASLDLIALATKGPKDAFWGAAKSIVNSAVDFQEIAFASQLGLYDEYLMPEKSKTPTQRFLNVSSEKYIKDWTKHDAYQDLVAMEEYPDPGKFAALGPEWASKANTAQGWANVEYWINPETKKFEAKKEISVDQSDPSKGETEHEKQLIPKLYGTEGNIKHRVDLRKVDNFRDQVRRWVVFADNDPEAETRKVAGALADALDITVSKNPEVLINAQLKRLAEEDLKKTGGTLGIVYDQALLNRVAPLQARIAEIKKLDAAWKQDKWEASPFRTPLTPFKEDKYRVAQNAFGKAEDKFLADIALNKDGLGDLVAEFSPEMYAWAVHVRDRGSQFYIKELIEKRGDLAKRVFWRELHGKTILRYTRPSYYLQPIVNVALGYTGWREDKVTHKRYYDVVGYQNNPWKYSPAWFWNKAIGPMNEIVRRATQALLKNPATRGLINILSGKQLIKRELEKISQKLLIRLGIVKVAGGAAVLTGAGAIPILVASAVFYVQDVVGELMGYLIKLDFEGITKKLSKEVQTTFTLLTTCITLVLMLFFVIISFFSGGNTNFFSAVRSTSTGVGGTIPGPGGPGPGSISCGVTLLGYNLDQFFSRMPTVAPITGGSLRTISSCYGECRNHGGYFHGGIDLPTPLGTEVRSPYEGDAIVVYSGWDSSGFGNLVMLQVAGNGDSNYADDPDYLFMLFGHNSAIPSNIQVGTVVHGGDLIAYAGSTGNSTGPHVHFEVRSGSRRAQYAVNPCAFMACPGASAPYPFECPRGPGNLYTPYP